MTSEQKGVDVRDERSAQAAGIAGYCFLFGCGGILMIVALAQLFGKFRHVMPHVREWLLVNGDSLREVLLRWVA